MITRYLIWLAFVSCSFAWTPTANAESQTVAAFSALFNGRDLSGWRGLGHFDPNELAKLDAAARAQKQAADDADLRAHWRVENGEIISDGHGVFLTTKEDYGDFELELEWKMMTPAGDSGIYLRGCPQVQIWDPNNTGEFKNGADKGSGALWNNNAPAGKFPLVRADRPIGEWNQFRIRMIGSRVTVRLNGELTVADEVMENFFDRARPIFPRGPIQLQTHGSEMRFRNLAIRELSATDATLALRAGEEADFRKLFDGKSLTGWTGATSSYEVTTEGTLRCKAGEGGNLWTAEQFDDFELRFEFKLPPGGNNGLGIRSPLAGDAAYAGMELQILDDTAERYRDLKPYQAHGSLYGVAPAHRGFLRPVGAWNYEHVLVRGSLIEVWLNGFRILNCDVDRIGAPADGHAHPGTKNRVGHIGFLGHGDPVEFRNISVRVATPSKP